MWFHRSRCYETAERKEKTSQRDSRAALCSVTSETEFVAVLNENIFILLFLWLVFWLLLSTLPLLHIGNTCCIMIFHNSFDLIN